MKFETKVVRIGGEADESTGAIAPPIHLSTTYEHGPANEIPKGFQYIRGGNPTQARLETALAAIDSGEVALSFSSGLAAGASFLQSLSPGSHVVVSDDTYYDIRTIARDFLPRWGMSSSIVDLSNTEALSEALSARPTLVWLETPSNPLMRVFDIESIAAAVHSAGAKLLVDGTFATPALQRPLELGADYVMQSTTKYLGGHSDVQGGAMVFRSRDETVERLHRVRTVLGAVASPFNSWLILRGIRTLVCRVERQSSSALAIAEALSEEDRVEAVYYPGLASHPGHEIAARQMSAYGGMLSFCVAGGRDAAIDVASRVELFTNATSLGGVESLIEHRRSAEGETSLAPANLLRVSVGLEAPEDLISDLRQALRG